VQGILCFSVLIQEKLISVSSGLGKLLPISCNRVAGTFSSGAKERFWVELFWVTNVGLYLDTKGFDDQLVSNGGSIERSSGLRFILSEIGRRVRKACHDISDVLNILLKRAIFQFSRRRYEKEIA
jgi:hypothetical protein